MISLIAFLASNYPLDYAEDILFEPEFPIYQGNASIARFDSIGDILCGKTDASTANILALDFMHRQNEEIPKILAAIGASISTARSIIRAIPSQHQAIDAIERYIKNYASATTEAVSAFRQLRDLSETPKYTNLASRLAAVHYYQIHNHYDWSAEHDFAVRLREAITAHYEAPSFEIC